MRPRWILLCCLILTVCIPARGETAPPKGTVSLALRDTPLRQALEILFTQFGAQYSVEAGVPNVQVTLNVKDMPFDSALRELLRLATVKTATPGVGISIQAPEVRRVGDLYVIGLKEAAPEPIAPGGGFGAYPGSVPTLATAKLTLRYLRPDEFIALLGPNRRAVGGVGIFPVPTGNSIIVQGLRPQIEEVQGYLRLVDVAPATLTFHVGIEGPGVNGQPVTFQSSAQTLEGKGVTIDEQSDVKGRPVRLKVKLEPFLQGDGGLQVQSDWDVLIPLAGGAKGPIQFVKRLSTSTQLQPGQEARVAEVNLNQWGGKGTLRLWIRCDWVRGEWQRGGRARPRPARNPTAGTAQTPR